MVIRSETSFGFRLWTGRPGAMGHFHVHSDLELNYLVSGRMRYFMAGRFHEIASGRLAMLWGSMPHQVTWTSSDATAIWMTIPLAWFMQSDPPALLTKALLTGRLVQARKDQTQSESDLALLNRWLADWKHPTSQSQRVVMLEAEARWRRLAMERSPARTQDDSWRDAGLAHVQTMTAYLSANYGQAVSIADVANAAGLHPNYAMGLFRRVCGVSMGQYLTQLRLSHAQRLLMTSDRKMLDVALASGFGSLSRFYEAFVDRVGQTPRRYRLKMRRQA